MSFDESVLFVCCYPHQIAMLTPYIGPIQTNLVSQIKKKTREKCASFKNDQVVLKTGYHSGLLQPPKFSCEFDKVSIFVIKSEQEHRQFISGEPRSYKPPVNLSKPPNWQASFKKTIHSVFNELLLKLVFTNDYCVVELKNINSQGKR